MAKKHISRIVIAGLGIGVLLAVIVPVMIFIFGFGIPVPDEPITIQKVLDDANKGLTLPVCTVASDCEELFTIENKTIIEHYLNQTKQGEQEPVLPPVITEPEPPKPEPISMEIISTVSKVDNTGKRTESKTNTGIPLLSLLSFFVEDTSNIDFDNGILEQTLKIKTKPDIEVTANAKFDVKIGKKSLLESPIIISTQGVTDSNGELSLDYKPNPSVASKEYLFNFKDHITDFNTTGITKVALILSEITVDANNQKFSLSNSTIFSMDIARDPDQLLIKSENGQIIRIYPTDSSLKITSITGSYTWYVNQCVFGKAYACYRYGAVAYSYCLEAPAMGGGTVSHLKSDGTVDGLSPTFPSNNAGGGTGSQSCPQIPVKIDIKLQRNEIYKIDFSNPAGSVTFKTPKDKPVAYSFYCQNTGTSGALTKYCNYADKLVTDPLTASLGK